MSYQLAQIATDTFQEDPLGLDRIVLDFESGRKWVIKKLVFSITNQRPEEGYGIEQLSPGTTVAVFTPLTGQEILGHLDVVR